VIWKGLICALILTQLGHAAPTTVFAVVLAVPAASQARLILPPHLEDVAKAHHCQPVSGFVTDGESSDAAPYDFRYEFDYEPPKVLLAAWCTKDGPQSKGTYTLLIWAERPDHPLRSCPDEIPNVPRIGRPELDAWPMVPRDFVMMDTGERLTVRESRIMFGVRHHVPWGKDFYACVAGGWAHYSPEKK
jgi:hypothetical protein